MNCTPKVLCLISGGSSYIEYYNNKRIKSRLKGKSPVHIPNSFYNWIMFNPYNFLGSLHFN